MYELRRLAKSPWLPLALLWAMAIAEIATGPAWIYTPAGIDAWVYHGYFLSLREHLTDFAGTYYGSRMAWILPGFLPIIICRRSPRMWRCGCWST